MRPWPRSVNRIVFCPCRSDGSIVQFAVQRRPPPFAETMIDPLSVGIVEGALMRSAAIRFKLRLFERQGLGHEKSIVLFETILSIHLLQADLAAFDFEMKVVNV